MSYQSVLSSPQGKLVIVRTKGACESVCVKARELFQRAVEAVGENELQKRLGFTLNTAARQFGRWKSGRGAPNFQHTITLLDAAGLLRHPDEIPRLQELTEQVEALQEELALARRQARRR